MSRLSVLLVIPVLILGCHSNPYSGLTGKVIKDPVEHKPVQPNYTIEAPPLVDLPEATKVPVKVAGYIEGAKATLHFEVAGFPTMPGWITYDATTSIMTFAPQRGDAFDPAHPMDTVRTYTVIVTLTDGAGGVAKSQKTIVVVVHHLAVGLTVTGFDDAKQILEGDSYSTTLQISSPDFPRGPFVVSGNDLPSGLKITSTGDPTKFILSYAPGASSVTTSSPRIHSCWDPSFKQHMCIDLPFTLNVIDPRGNQATPLAANWEVMDLRIDPRVARPSAVTGTIPSAEFYVQVEDRNGEIIPLVSVIQPSEGTASVSVVESMGPSPGLNPYALVKVLWTGVPATSKGTTKNLEVKSCVRDKVFSINRCVTTPVSVTFQ